MSGYRLATRKEVPIPNLVFGYLSIGIKCLSETPDGQTLLFGTYDGLRAYVKSGSHGKTANGGREAEGLTHSAVESILFDRAGTLWIGTYAGGINYMHGHSPFFRHYFTGNPALGIISCMISDPAKAREIRPAPANPVLDGLLTLTSARVLPLPSGGSYSGYAGDLSCFLVAAVQGTVTACAYAQSDVLSPGQALAFWQCGEFTVQSVGDSVCMLVQLQGELPGRLLAPRLTDGAALFPRGGGAVREAVLALAVLDQEHARVSGTSASAHAYTMLANLISAASGISSLRPGAAGSSRIRTNMPGRSRRSGFRNTACSFSVPVSGLISLFQKSIRPSSG